MDEDDFKYAEFIFQNLKEKQKILAGDLSEFTHHTYKGSQLKTLLNFDHIYKYLEKVDLITIDYGTPGRVKPQVIIISEIGKNLNSVKERIIQIDALEKIQIEREIMERKKIDLEIRYLEVQIWANQKWYMIAGGSALIGVVLSKAVDWIISSQ